MQGAKGRRRRWSVAWTMSVAAHALLVVFCLIGGAPRGELVMGPQGARDAPEVRIPFDLLARAEAAPAPPVTVVAPAAAVPRRGHAVRRPRPGRSVPVSMATAAAIEPPAFPDQGHGEDEVSARAPAGPVSSEGAASLGTAAVAAPAPEGPSVTAAEARYLRTFESFPSLPPSLWVSGRVYAVIAQVCVSAAGRVADVAIKRGAAPELDRAVAHAMRSWRYRPRLIAGTPRPFCHLMKLEFSLRQ